MKAETTVMVTGVGAIIGYGVLRSIRVARPDVRLVGSDIYADAVGQAWCDDFVQAPLASDATYADWLREQVTSRTVDLLIPAIEQDVDFLIDHPSALDGTSCRPVVNDRRLVRLGRDKLLMDQELISVAEPSRIVTRDRGTFAELSAALGLPFLLKPRRGYASKGIVTVEDEATFERLADRVGPDLVAQQIVGTADSEYTVSVFGDGAGEYSTLSCLRRRLAPDGSTVKAVNVDSSDVGDLTDTVRRLVAHFEPVGPTNLQFRVHDGCCKLLEINPRISSSTSIRTAFGHNEAVMCIDYFLDGRMPEQPTFQSGRAARYIEDVVIVDRPDQ